MSIQYSGNVGIYTYTTGGTTMATDMEAALLTNLVTAGWTNAPVAASATATFSGQPSDGDTITLDSGSAGSKVYRFKNTMAQVNDIQIDGSLLTTTLSNLVAGITAGAGSGTAYFAGTTAHTTMTAVKTSGTIVTVSYKTAGSAGNGSLLAKSSSAITLGNSGTLAGGYNFLVSAITPQNLQGGMKMFTESGSLYNPGAKLQIQAASSDGTLLQGGNHILQAAPAANTTWKLIASKYQWMNIAVGTSASTTTGNGVAIGVPFITTNLVAPLIVAATNASPISCNVPSHGFSNGQTVYIQQGTGMTAINGTFVITVVDGNNFTLNGSTGNGTYVGNSASVTNVTLGTSINQAIWACGSDAAAPTNLRGSGHQMSDFCWQCVNGQTVSASTGTDRPQIVKTGSVTVALTAQQQWYDNTYLIAEPFIAWGVSGGATPKIIGQLWDSVIVRAAITIDQTAVFDSPSHTFWTVGTDGSSTSLMWATTA